MVRRFEMSILFESTRLKKMTLRNRFVRSATDGVKRLRGETSE